VNKTSIFASTVLAAIICGSLGACATASAVAEEQGGPPIVADAAPAETVELTVTVRGVRAGRGPVMVALYDSEAGWSGGAEPVAAARLAAEGTEVTARFDDLPSGSYGVKLFQDLDANGAMNTNMFGIPTEPYGFSNDAPVRFGPPAWEAAAFSANTATVVHVITLPE
jgi:uncharacterized protein (DUF2141 family)